MSLLQAISKVSNSLDSNTTSSGEFDDLKQATLELVMPKIDADTIARYSGGSNKSGSKNLEEQERIERQRNERENTNMLHSVSEPVIKEEFNPSVQDDI